MGQKADVVSKDSTTQSKSAAEPQRQGEATHGFVDNRPISVAQRILMEQNNQPAENSPYNFLRNPVQRVEDEELLQGRFDTAQRLDAEEEEPVQGKFENDSSTAQLQESTAPAENKTGMPDNLKAGIESLSGMDMSDVRVHRNSDKPAQLNAHAYAQGNDIHLGPGQEQHLPHEAWHVVQQRQGRVKPTMQMKGGVQVNDDVSLEWEADVMGNNAQDKGVDSFCLKGNEGSFHSLNTTGVAMRMPFQLATESENKIGEVVGSTEGDSGWHIVVDIDSWLDEEQRQELIDEKVDIVQQNIIEKVCADAGYNADNANRLVIKNPYKRSDIKGKTKVSEGPSLYNSDDSHEVTNKIISFDEDDLGVKNITHQLYFEFLYSNGDTGSMVQKYIARNPLLAEFYASDVVEEQVNILKDLEWAEDPEYETSVMEAGFKWETIRVDHIVNPQFLEWWNAGEPSLAVKYASGGELEDIHAQYFLDVIPNGKLAKRNAEDSGKEIDSIDVEKLEESEGWSFVLKLLDKDDEESPDVDK